MASELLKIILSVAAVLMVALSTFLASKDTERKLGQTPLVFDPGSGKPSWLSKHRLIVAIALAAVLGMAQQLMIRRETLDAAERERYTEEAAGDASTKASLAATSAESAATSAGQAAEKAEVAAVNAELAIKEIGKTANAILALSKDVQLAKAETTRVSDRITSITLEMQFSLPMSDPALSEYKKRVYDGVMAFNSKYPLTDENEDHIGFGSGTSGRVPVYFDFLHPLAPLNENEHEVKEALFLPFIELAFFRTPISAEEYEFTRAGDIFIGGRPPLRKRPPDLSIAAVSRPNVFVYVRPRQDVPEASTYRVWLVKWSPRSSEWINATRRLTHVDELPKSQLILGIGKLLVNRQDTALRIRREFELEFAKIEINNMTMELDKATFTRRFDADGNPIWEYLFPEDLTTILSPGV